MREKIITINNGKRQKRKTDFIISFQIYRLQAPRWHLKQLVIYKFYDLTYFFLKNEQPKKKL